MVPTQRKCRWSVAFVVAVLLVCTGEVTAAEGERKATEEAQAAQPEKETFTKADAPRKVSITGRKLTLDTPYGYDKPENSERLYPIVVNGCWGEGWAFTGKIRAQYPAFFLEYQKRNEADGEALSDILDAAIAQGNRIDLNRIYLTGFSAGGSGSYKLVRGFLKKGKLFAAINRVAGQSEAVLPDKAVALTSIWLHIGTKDRVVRVRITRQAYENLKSHPLNKDAVETVKTDEDVIGYKRVTKTLTKRGIEIVKYSVCEGMDHDPKPVYKDPEVFKWMFAQSLEKRRPRPVERSESESEKTQR
jgi:hypothetical protein